MPPPENKNLMTINFSLVVQKNVFNVLNFVLKTYGLNLTKHLVLYLAESTPSSPAVKNFKKKKY